MTIAYRSFFVLGFIFLVLPLSINATLKKEQINQLNAIHHTHRITFFCEQSFQENGDLILPRCQSCPTSTLKVQWMPIIPLSHLASHLSCYRDKLCLDKNAKSYGGLRCCQKISPLFNEMKKDLYNYVPENPTIARLKGHYAYGELSETSYSKSGCHFKIDKKRKQVAPKPQLLGQIARTYLYFHQHYQLPLTYEEKTRYARWNKEYPLTDWERKRNQLIFEQQGKHTTYLF